MLHVRDFVNDDIIFEALNSKLRRCILDILVSDGPKNLDQLAKKLGVTNGALTTHIKILEQANLIRTEFVPARRGNSKRCFINETKIIVDLFSDKQDEKRSRETDIDIGSYTDYKVIPTCGLVTKDKEIGKFDDPRYFAYPERTNAALLWFATGYVEYILPNLLKENEQLEELQFVFEIASEAPGFIENFPSDIYFWLNDKCLGYWTIAGEHNDRRGLFTPNWWDPRLGQYGIIYILSLNKSGAYFNGWNLPIAERNGVKYGGCTLDDFHIDEHTELKFRLESPSDTRFRGGLSLFGKGFGDYNRGITFRIVYSDGDNK